MPAARGGERLRRRCARLPARPRDQVPRPARDCLRRALAGGQPGPSRPTASTWCCWATARAATSPRRQRSACGTRAAAIAAQVLLYPCLAPARTSTFASYTQYADGPLMTRADMVWFWAHYLRSAADDQDPRAAPLVASDLTGLPPARSSSPSSIRCATKGWPTPSGCGPPGCPPSPRSTAGPPTGSGGWTARCGRPASRRATRPLPPRAVNAPLIPSSTAGTVGFAGLRALHTVRAQRKRVAVGILHTAEWPARTGRRVRPAGRGDRHRLVGRAVDPGPPGSWASTSRLESSNRASRTSWWA